MTRKEVYAVIKEHSLQDAANNYCGGNYTRIPTDKLLEFLWNYDACLVDGDYSGIEDNAQKNGQKDVQKTKQESAEVENPYEAACVAFVGILKDSGLLDGILAKL